MTEDSAQKVANVVIGVAVAGAAFYILKTPSLRRMAWRLALTALTGTIPVWVATETRKAWDESGRMKTVGPGAL